MTATEPVAPTDLILGFLAQPEHYANDRPWIPLNPDNPDQPWFTTATLRALVASGRVVVYRFDRDRFHGLLDGQPAGYVYAYSCMAGNGRELVACPDICPECGINLKSEGYPLGHRTDEGDECRFLWAPGNPFDHPEQD